VRDLSRIEGSERDQPAHLDASIERTWGDKAALSKVGGTRPEDDLLELVGLRALEVDAAVEASAGAEGGGGRDGGAMIDIFSPGSGAAGYARHTRSTSSTTSIAA
jgi:hypothetical protein